MPAWLPKEDEPKWDKAKAAFKKSKGRDPKEDSDWAIVTHIYKQMGGKIEAVEKMVEKMLTKKEQDTVAPELDKTEDPNRPMAEEPMETDIVHDHKHTWKPEAEYTDSTNGHKHPIDPRSDIAGKGDTDHEHKLLRPGPMLKIGVGPSEAIKKRIDALTPKSYGERLSSLKEKTNGRFIRSEIAPAMNELAEAVDKGDKSRIKREIKFIKDWLEAIARENR